MLVQQQGRKWPGVVGLSGLRGVRPTRRHGRKPLGCASCAGKRLGQDDGGDVFGSNYDPFSSSPTMTVPYANAPAYSGGYDTGPAIVDCMANPYGAGCGNPLTAESPYSYGMSTAGVNNSLINAARNPSSPNSLLYSPTLIPGTTSTIPTVPGIPGIPGLPSIGTPTQMVAQGSPAASSAALNSMLPLLLLAGGGIALIAVLKRH